MTLREKVARELWRWDGEGSVWKMTWAKTTEYDRAVLFAEADRIIRMVKEDLLRYHKEAPK